MDDRPLDNCVVLTSSERPGSIRARDTEKPKSVAYGLLNPLRTGKPVVLLLEDQRLPKRKRVDKPKLFLTPMSVYGPPSSKIVVSLETHGCEVVDTKLPIRPLSFIRLGMRAELSKVLASELNLLFNHSEGATNGS